MSKMRLFVTDDHALVREGIISMVKSHHEIVVVGSATCGVEAIDKLEHIECDVVLMDIQMPGLNGVETTTALLKKYPHLKVLLLSMEIDCDYITEGIKAGISGYIPKDCEKSVMLSAIEQVFKGETYFHQKIMQHVFDAFYTRNKSIGEGIPNMSDKISDREKEVLKLVADGKSNGEIAEHLYISVRTVDTHKNRIMKKINANSTVDLVKYALKHDLALL
ncbi:MAG: response regulator transcription factor [Bacteroidota bacterium]